MSDYLVKRARHNALADMPHFASVELIEALADRIEELEADLRKMALDLIAADGQAAEAYQAQLAAEAKLAKAVDVIDWALICWDAHDTYGCMMQGDWVSDARTTLAELKGEK